MRRSPSRAWRLIDLVNDSLGLQVIQANVESGESSVRDTAFRKDSLQTVLRASGIALTAGRPSRIGSMHGDIGGGFARVIIPVKFEHA
jgi:hypothetical protein